MTIFGTAICLAVLFLFLSFESRKPKESDEFQILFGIMDLDEEGFFDVVHQTTRIPMRRQETGFCFGYSVYPPDSRLYTTHEVISLPARPRHLGFPELVENRDGGRVLVTPNILRQYQAVYPFCFSEGDPLGDWKLDVFINDKLARTFRFQVVQP